VKDIIRKGERKALVLKWKDSEETCGYWPSDLLKKFNELAQMNVESGEFETIEQALEHLGKTAIICTEEDYNLSQERLFQF
jgi:hypothetical protein